MNDYWDYLAHSQVGQERANHRYYARIPDGRDAKGFRKYRYFYSKEDYTAYVQSGRKKLTGEYKMETHPNGRTVYTATQQYIDKDGKLQTGKKYISREEGDKLRDAQYRRERAANETPEEKAARTKAAKKRYKQETKKTRRKRAVQKGMQTVSRLLGKQMTYMAPKDRDERARYKKSKWRKSLLIPGAYTRKLQKGR